MVTDLPFLTAGETAQAIRERRISVVDTVEAQLDRIARYNGALNAVVTLDEALARQRAVEADRALARGELWGPLHGVPITVKDFFAVAGIRSTCSYPPLATYVPECDAVAVARLRRAGAIIMGKTNLPQLAMDYQTVSPLFGRASNPWDHSRTPGGSTGGGAAAVAAGLSCLELGSDLAGSIRVPAHFCGIYAIAPTANLVPRTGSLPDRPGGGTLSTFLRIGALSRSVADLELFLDLVAGPDASDPGIPPVALDLAPARPLAGLRLAWTDDLGVPVCEDTRRAMASFAACLSDRGCYAERTNPSGFDPSVARELHTYFLMTAVGAMLPVTARLAGRFIGRVRAFDLDLPRYLQAESQRIQLMAALEQFLAGWDAWMCPVTSTPAFAHLSPSRTTGSMPIYPALDVDGQQVNYTLANGGFTTPFNVTGNPVVVIPIGQSAEGLPVGIQVVGRSWHDRELLGVAKRLADCAGPLRHPPGYDDGER